MSSVSDFDDARLRMVNDQVRPMEVNDPRVVTAMRELRREDAVPDEQKPFAYADRTLPLGHGRYLLQPMVTARLVQMMQVEPGQRVLVVGAATGYLASVIARLDAEVFALEENDALSALGKAYTSSNAPDIVWRKGALANGDSEDAPFDLIVFAGAISEIPQFCTAQMAPKGRVAGIMRPENGTSSAFLAEAEESGGWSVRFFFDAAAPFLSAFEKTAAFAL
ncbi:protein-L-isoaspartate O-methyltransferase family protein [Acetobacter sp.]|uniref:protein-L-isoaspartate O-methyltransferase family protein n=1 Tax=Acetobacter sp. TaxID=440 RepID=UPI0039EC98AD